MSDFSGGMDELVYSVYLSSELIGVDTQTVDGLGILLAEAPGSACATPPPHVT